MCFAGLGSGVQTRAHTGLRPGVSNAKVPRRHVCTATRLCTVALRQYSRSVCSGLQYSSFPDTILSGNEDYARPLMPVSFSGLGLWR